MMIADFFKLVLYLTFFCVLCIFYGMPIHIIRDVALTIRSFHKRITDFVRYRQATRDMNARYPDATSEEVNREDCCIICREDMKAWSPEAAVGVQQDGNVGVPPSNIALDERLRPKKLPCGHVLHFACLRSWLERQQNCPTCRAPVLTPGGATHPQSQFPANQPPRGMPEAGAPNPMPGQGRNPPVMPAPNVYQIGPFRIAFGARDGFQGALPNMHRPDQRAGAGDANLPAMGSASRAARQPAPSQSRNVATSSPMTTSFQLQQIEQRLVRDANSLRLQADQLYTVRSLQNELSRLRALQANPNAPFAESDRTSSNVNTTVNPHFGQPGQISPSFVSNRGYSSMGTGHEHLPAGMSVPAGWTILPLSRLPGSSGSSPPDGSPSHHTLNRNTQAEAETSVTSAGAKLPSPAAAAKEQSSLAPQADPEDGKSPERRTGELKPPQSSDDPPASALLSRSVETLVNGGSSEDRYHGGHCPGSENDDRLQLPSNRHKGKGRASTVEDSVEDTD